MKDLLCPMRDLKPKDLDESHQGYVLIYDWEYCELIFLLEKISLHTGIKSDPTSRDLSIETKSLLSSLQDLKYRKYLPF